MVLVVEVSDVKSAKVDSGGVRMGGMPSVLDIMDDFSRKVDIFQIVEAL